MEILVAALVVALHITSRMLRSHRLGDLALVATVIEFVVRVLGG